MRLTDRSSLLRAAAIGVLVGLSGTLLWSADEVDWEAVSSVRVTELTRLEPIRVLPRAELTLIALQASGYLDEGRPWAAWRLLRDHLDDLDSAPAGAVLLAARAAGEWGGWRQARDLLADRGWLDRAEGGEGRLLLGRAEEALGDEEAAIRAYRRYAALPGATAPGVAHARLGQLLREEGDHRDAAASFAAAASAFPEIADWLHALQLEQLAEAKDPSVPALAARAPGGSAPVRLRRVLAEAAAAAASGDEGRAMRRLEWEAAVLRGQGARAEAAEAEVARARLLLRGGEEEAARGLLRAVAAEGAAEASVRLAAAQLLGERRARTAAEELARAAGYEAAASPGLAARSVGAAISAGGGGADLRLRQARLLYAERDFGPARVAFRAAAEAMTEREQIADAELYAARSLYRGGGASDRSRAVAEFRRVSERFEGTPAAGSALFLLGDEAASMRAAVELYRRAAAVRRSPDAREALFRVGDRSLRLEDTGAAIRAWEDYVERYPRGQESARIAYEVGRLHSRDGRKSRARAMFTAAILADPLSYPAMRAGERLDIDPLRQILAEPRPWVGLAGDPMEAQNVLRRLDTLARLGLSEERDAELAGAVRGFGDRPTALLVLAEGVRDRGGPVEGINLAYRLLEKRGGEWDRRLLRLAFPFPYREILVREAEREGIDPMLLAGLVRQESSFRADARSRVGATGLGQIMPATGEWLAPSVGIRGWEPRLLRVPEVNLGMSATYLSDLLNRYDGQEDLALAGYNAGPGRADRWKRELRRGDSDDFRERIPFDETRAYVKLVLRNAGVYRSIYGAGVD